jgi:hypothetical protein
MQRTISAQQQPKPSTRAGMIHDDMKQDTHSANTSSVYLSSSATIVLLTGPATDTAEGVESSSHGCSIGMALTAHASPHAA